MGEFWYVLLHVALGFLGKDVFAFSNMGTVYVAAATALVQFYPMYLIHRPAWAKFAAMRSAAASADDRADLTRGYWRRWLRVYISRVAIYALLTLAGAAAFRG